jgi:hypothetical protein
MALACTPAVPFVTPRMADPGYLGGRTVPRLTPLEA